MQRSCCIVIWRAIEYIRTHGNSCGISYKTVYFIQSAAGTERIVANDRNGVGDTDASQVRETIGEISRDSLNTVSYINGRDMEVIKRPRTCR